jgi:hypothetical protein
MQSKKSALVIVLWIVRLLVASRPSFWMVVTMTLSARSSERRRSTRARVLVFS